MDILVSLFLIAVLLLVGGSILLNDIAYKQTHYPDGTMRKCSNGSGYSSTSCNNEDEEEVFQNYGNKTKKTQDGIFDSVQGRTVNFGEREYDAYCYNAENEDFDENNEETWGV